MRGTSRPMLARDIASVEIVEELDLAPDGSFAVVAKRRIRRRRGQLVYESHLYLVDLCGNPRPRPLTDGVVRDSLPRVAPDGRTVAFRRSDPCDDDAEPQLCLLDVATGRVRVLAPTGRAPGYAGICEPVWC